MAASQKKFAYGELKLVPPLQGSRMAGLSKQFGSTLNELANALSSGIYQRKKWMLQKLMGDYFINHWHFAGVCDRIDRYQLI